MKMNMSKTNIYTDNDKITNVVYYSTPIVRFNDYCISLDTGAYFTFTTKLRMNQVSKMFNLGYHVFQKNFKWFVKYQSKIIPFIGNRVKLDRNF